jgi:hypothetical protein
MRRASHPHIIQYYGVTELKGKNNHYNLKLMFLF